MIAPESLENRALNTNSNPSPADSERRGDERIADNAGWEAKVVARLRRRVEQFDALAEERDTGWEQETLTVLRERLADD